MNIKTTILPSTLISTKKSLPFESSNQNFVFISAQHLTISVEQHKPCNSSLCHFLHAVMFQVLTAALKVQSSLGCDAGCRRFGGPQWLRHEATTRPRTRRHMSDDFQFPLSIACSLTPWDSHVTSPKRTPLSVSECGGFRSFYVQCWRDQEMIGSVRPASCLRPHGRTWLGRPRYT